MTKDAIDHLKIQSHAHKAGKKNRHDLKALSSHQTLILHQVKTTNAIICLSLSYCMIAKKSRKTKKKKSVSVGQRHHDANRSFSQIAFHRVHARLTFLVKAVNEPRKLLRKLKEMCRITFDDLELFFFSTDFHSHYTFY